MDARTNIQREIEALEAGPTPVDRGCAFIEDATAISDLKRSLREIEDGLAKLGTDDA